MCVCMSMSKCLRVYTLGEWQYTWVSQFSAHNINKFVAKICAWKIADWCPLPSSTSLHNTTDGDIAFGWVWYIVIYEPHTTITAGYKLGEENNLKDANHENIWWK